MLEFWRNPFRSVTNHQNSYLSQTFSIHLDLSISTRLFLEPYSINSQIAHHVFTLKIAAIW